MYNLALLSTLLQANEMKRLIDLYFHRLTVHMRSDCNVLTTADWLIDFYADRFTGHVRSDYI
jgi:hypothetical protein